MRWWNCFSPNCERSSMLYRVSKFSSYFFCSYFSSSFPFLAHFDHLLLHIRHKMHRFWTSFSDQLQSRFLHLESQTLGFCLAFDVNHIVIPSHSHCSSEPQKVKLPNRESKEDLQKRLRWFLIFLTLDFIGILRYSNLHYQIRKD